MALQSSGQISLNDIHIEAGGSSGTQAGINDSDIRGLIGASSASEMEFADFYGASSGAEFVGAVTRRENDERGIDSSAQAINLTGAGVQTGDLVVIAITADTSDHTNMNLIGMSEVKLHDSGNNLPVSLVFYGYWAAGNSNPYLDGTGGTATQGTCAWIFDCFDGCPDNDTTCAQGCYSSANFTAQFLYDDLSFCAEFWCAPDYATTCLETWCVSEINACFADN